VADLPSFPRFADLFPPDGRPLGGRPGGAGAEETYRSYARPVAGTNPSGGSHRRTRAGVALTMSTRRGIGNHE
jgi:hypothetical protein